MFQEYNFILKFILVSLIVAIILVSISIFMVIQQADTEKVSAYECGFNPYGDARNKFQISFYLVGILFIIFDLEITYLIPWIISWWNLNFYGKLVMYLFILILTIGFIVELYLGALVLNNNEK